MPSRSFYSFETSEFDIGPHRERSSLLKHYQKEEERGGNPLTTKKSKSKLNKHSSRELNGKDLEYFF